MLRNDRKWRCIFVLNSAWQGQDMALYHAVEFGYNVFYYYEVRHYHLTIKKNANSLILPIGLNGPIIFPRHNVKWSDFEPQRTLYTVCSSPLEKNYDMFIAVFKIRNNMQRCVRSVTFKLYMSCRSCFQNNICQVKPHSVYFKASYSGDHVVRCSGVGPDCRWTIDFDIPRF